MRIPRALRPYGHPTIVVEYSDLRQALHYMWGISAMPWQEKFVPEGDQRDR